jgi:hypothetical protein
VALRLLETRDADRLFVFACRGAAGDRQEPTEIVGDEVRFAILERVDLPAEGVEIDFESRRRDPRRRAERR